MHCCVFSHYLAAFQRQTNHQTSKHKGSIASLPLEQLLSLHQAPGSSISAKWKRLSSLMSSLNADEVADEDTEMKNRPRKRSNSAKEEK